MVLYISFNGNEIELTYSNKLVQSDQHFCVVNHFDYCRLESLVFEISQLVVLRCVHLLQVLSMELQQSTAYEHWLISMTYVMDRMFYVGFEMPAMMMMMMAMVESALSIAYETIQLDIRFCLFNFFLVSTFESKD